MGRYGLFTAEQLATRFELSLELINHYTKKDLLLPIKLHDGTFFSANDFIRLEVIEKGKRLGFSLAEIKRLMDSVRRLDHESPLVSG